MNTITITIPEELLDLQKKIIRAKMNDDDSVKAAMFDTIKLGEAYGCYFSEVLNPTYAGNHLFELDRTTAVAYLAAMQTIMNLTKDSINEQFPGIEKVSNNLSKLLDNAFQCVTIRQKKED